jgi:hypothetical protein
LIIDGKCGVCGDSLSAPVREHEVGGKYATGIIVRSYKVGQWIDINIMVQFFYYNIYFNLNQYFILIQKDIIKSFGLYAVQIVSSK